MGALCANWRALNDASGSAAAGAVVKADAYGLGMDRVAPALAREGARQFFVAIAEEGATLRNTLGAGPEIFVFSGHMAGDTDLVRDYGLTPLLNSVDQCVLHLERLPGHPFGIQLDTGMNRLGMEPAEWAAVRDLVMPLAPRLVMSHLACADEPGHGMNSQQLAAFRSMTTGLSAPLSLAATGGTLLGPDYHFDLTRPGIGVYGGLPFIDAQPVVELSLPVIQIRDVEAGETVGYGNTWVAERPSRIATVSGGYADGLIRMMGPKAVMRADETACPVVGRVSMDLIGVDVTDAPFDPTDLTLIGRHHSVDTVADWAGTIGYEILTSLGTRYARSYRAA